MFEFEMPVGGIVEINRKRFRHFGGGRFTGLGGDERLYLLEGVSDKPTLDDDTLLLRDHLPGDVSKPVYRVVWNVHLPEEG